MAAVILCYLMSCSCTSLSPILKRFLDTDRLSLIHSMALHLTHKCQEKRCSAISFSACRWSSPLASNLEQIVLAFHMSTPPQSTPLHHYIHYFPQASSSSQSCAGSPRKHHTSTSLSFPPLNQYPPSRSNSCTRTNSKTGIKS